jgi:chemotaxis protein methyltransferase CheR
MSADHDFVREFMRQRAGNVLGPDKDYLIDSRLRILADQRGLPDVASLVGRLRVSPDHALATDVIDALTTHETYFFRDMNPFEALRDLGLPALMEARRRDRTLRIWCAACSTGQEPYSLAMLLRENLPELLAWDVSILATDVSTHAIAFAREGVYGDGEMRRGLPEALRAAWFRPVDGGRWRVDDRVRRMVTFRVANLLEDPSVLGTFDLVLMRNVLIYFDESTRTRILRDVRRVLNPGGLLLLGGSEATLPEDVGLLTVRLGRSVFFGPAGRREEGAPA